MHRPNAWRYRDYVIKSFNDDKPYDRFLIEQIAGDEMDGKTNDTLVATGFLRMGPRVLFREKDNPERRYDYLDEIIGTIGKGTLGLTVNCARCHHHKFDPISQKDYYAIEASIFGYVETEVPLAPKAEADAYLAKNAEIDGKIAELQNADRAHRAALPRHAAARAHQATVSRSHRAGHPQARSRTHGGRRAARGAGAESGQRAGGASGSRPAASGCSREEGSDDADRGVGEGAAGAAADGRDRDRRRLPFVAARRGRRHGELSQVPHPGAWRRSVRAHRPGTLRSAAVVLPHPRRRREPRIADEAGLHRGHHVRKSADRNSAARRPHVGTPARAGAVDRVAAEPDDRARHRQPVVAETLRPRHRRHARELRKDGRAAHASGSAGLDGRRARWRIDGA